MTDVLGALLIVVATQTAAIVALLIRGTRRTRAERALRESEERFRLMADRAPVMIWTARPETTLDYLNSTWVEFTGLPVEKLRDEGWLDAVHPEDRDHCTGIYVPAVEARTPFLMECRLRRADGEYRWVLDSGVPRYGPTHRRVTAWVAVAGTRCFAGRWSAFAGWRDMDIDLEEGSGARTVNADNSMSGPFLGLNLDV